MQKILLLLLAFSISLTIQAQQKRIATPTLVIQSQVKKTIKVSEMEPVTPEEWNKMVEQGKRKLKESEREKKENIIYQLQDDPVMQNFMPQGTRGANAPLLTFEGAESPNYPSDANGDVDSNYYVQAVNSTFSVYDKTGTLKAGPIALNNLFTGLPGGNYNDGDPVVLYDEIAKRWLITEMSKSGDNDYLMFAVSQTENPLGAWYSYSFDVDDWPDYPKYGIWRDAYYVGVDKLGNSTEDQEDVFAMQREKMLLGQPAKMVGFINPDRPDVTYSIAAPVDNDGAFAPVNTPGLFVAINDAQWNSIKDQLWIYEMDVDWNNTANSTFQRVQALDVAPFTPAPDPEQPTGSTLDALANYIMNKPVYRNFTSHQELVCCHAVEGNTNTIAGMRWYELRKTEGEWEIRQQGTYSPDNNSRWVGSITMNSNHRIAMGYSVTGSSTYPGIRYAAQSPSAYAAGNGTLDIAEEVIFNGLHPQGSSRWGDYSSISVDPSNDSVFWYTNQYSDVNRKTKISKFKFGPFSLTADFVVNTTDAGVGELVKFYDISYGSPTTWKWSFSPSTVTYAASTSSTSKEPWVQFSNPGTYTVKLVVGNGSTTDTLIRAAYITIDSLCLVSNFPWTEDFENGGNMPGCWSQEYVNIYNEDWKFQNGDGWYITSAHSGSYNAYFLKGTSDDAQTRLVLPPLDLSNLTAPQMDFWYGTSYGYYKFNVIYKSAATGVWTVLKTYENTTINSWVHDSIVLPNNTSDSWVAFEVIQNNGSQGLNIDDVTIKESTVGCAPPLGPQTSAWGDSARVSWIAQLYSPTYTIEYGAAGFTHGNGTTISNISDTAYTITGLSPNTTYDWYVKKNCSGTSSSTWTGPIRFTTTTSPYTLPVTEDFEGGFVKFGNASGNSVDFSLNTSLKHGGAKSARNEYSNNNLNYLVMNSYVDLSKTSHPFLTFWHIAKTGGGGDYCKVQISIDNGSTWRTLPTNSYEGDANNYGAYQGFNEDSYPEWGGDPATNGWWKKETFSLENFKEERVKVRFKLSSDNGIIEEGWYIDDITIEDNSCPGIYPDSLWTQNITATTAQLKWKERGSASAWDIEYGNAGFAQGTGITITGTTSNPKTITSLVAGTDYDWYVRSSCGGGNHSDWSGPESFSTPCNPSNLPYFEDFENVTNPYMPSCVTVVDANRDGTKWKTQNYNGYSGSGSAFIATPSDRSSDDWFFTPGFTLQAGVSYEIAFVYSTSSGHESLELKYGDYPGISSMKNNVIWMDDYIINWSFKLGKADITPSTTGVYYFGFHANSPIGSGGIYLDDIYVNVNSKVATWSGTSSSDWYNAANWNNDTLPTANTNVTVSATSANYPTLTKLSVAKNFTLGSQAENATLMGENFLKVSDTIYVKQFLTSGKWHLIAAPVKNVTVNQLYFNHNPDVWLAKYNEPTDNWTYLVDLNTSLPVAAGFAVWVENGKDTTVTFHGSFNSDDIYLDGSQWSTPQLSYSGSTHGYNLVGNPFPSALDWDSSGWDTTDISGSIWVWNSATGNYSYRNSQGQGSLTDGIIPRGQGFFIHAKSTNMYFTIPNSARVHSHQNYYKNTDETNDPYATIVCFKDDKKDEAWISFSENATDSFDDGFDVEKFFSLDEAPQIWFAYNNEDMSILSLPPLINDTRVVSLNFKAGSSGTQHLQLQKAEVMDNYEIYLEDVEQNKFIDFKKNLEYEFNTASTEISERFKLHFINSINNVSSNTDGNLIKIYALGKNVYIVREESTPVGKATVTMFDIMGRKLKMIVSENKIIKLSSSGNNKYVIVKVSGISGTTVKKVFINK